MHSCLVCGKEVSSFQDMQFDYNYHYCAHCHFIKKNNKLTPELEKLEYKRHNNTLANASYVNYWHGLINDYFLNYLTVQSRVLDYGSGLFPILQAILARDYHMDIDIYDLYFATSSEYKKKEYDVIFITEVIEHLDDPIPVLKHLIDLLVTNGRLIVMTLFHSNDEQQFNQWWYRRDPTHISFFDYHTFIIIAKQLNVEIEFSDDKRLIVLNKTI